ncbi:MAG TPA: 16S rRNA (guanine(966)-N(2))-methyltransferase RsmD [Tissierellaceae bacterium]
MRVISGTRKGHRLKSPKGMNIRPTEDRIKESVFNILGNIDEESIVLDGFGGTGSIGIEFLSRGAKFCYFVDSSNYSVKLIYENLAHTKFLEQSKVIKNDFFKALKILKKQGIVFNYIYLDPPFRQDGFISKILQSISNEDILSNDGLIIVEHESELKTEEKIYNLEKIDSRNYGNTTITFYRKVGE